MIAERTTGRTVESTLGGESVAMSIDVANMPHIMNILTDLYEDQEMACIREYSTNAFDAHVEAGVQRPIEVSLPSHLSPFLRIKDFGVGLAADDIRTIYSQYGTSTKRNSNDFNGMLGLGCKAALTYSDQFTVISTKDGRTVQVSISRAASGAGVMQIVSDQATDKPNGTEVIIPAKLPNRFVEKAARLFGYWEPDTVLVDGAAPASAEHMALTDDIWLIDGSQSYIVMGNVPYPARIRHDLPLGYDYGSRKMHPERSVAVFVPIGAVNFPPNRESVMSTDCRTQETIAAAESTIAHVKKGAVQRQIDAAPTPHEAIQALIQWTDALGLKIERDYMWKGKALPHSYEPENEFRVTGSNGSQIVTRMLLSDNSTKKLARVDRRGSLPIGMWEGTLLAYGYDRKGMTATQKRKLIQYVGDNNLAGIKRFALVAKKPNAEMCRWIGADHIIPWADVQAIKLPSTASVSNAYTGRLPGSYDLYDAGVSKHGVSGAQIDRSRPIFYVHGNMAEANRFAGLLTKHHPTCYVVALSANRIEKFCRILPAAKRCVQAVKECWESEAKKLTDDQRIALHIADKGDDTPLAKLDPQRLDDPALREGHRLANLDIRSLIAKRNEFARIVDTDTLDAVKWDNPLESYPLYAAMWVGYTHPAVDTARRSDDMYLYLNAKFAVANATTTKGA